jgi:hypothetical protein
MTDPMTTRGDIIYRNASNVTDRLGIGANTYVLTSDGTDASWQPAAGGGDVTKVGTPANTQIGVWTGDGTIGGSNEFTWNGVSGVAITGVTGGTGLSIDGANSALNLSGTGNPRITFDKGFVANILYTDTYDLNFYLPGYSSNLFLKQSTGSVGIGTTTPDASAALDVPSTTKGVLFPRMTTTEKNAISSPAEGLVVYDLTLHKLCVYTGSAWETVTSL